MNKTNFLLYTFIALLIVFITLISVYMKDTAEFRLTAKAERKELIDLNKEQIRLLKIKYENPRNHIR